MSLVDFIQYIIIVGTKISGSGCLFLNDGQSTYFQDPLHQNNTTTSKVKVGDVLIWDPEIYHFSPPIMEKRIILAFNLKGNCQQ